MHVLGVLPFLLLLACPLMHVFMHHGHGQSGHQQGRAGAVRRLTMHDNPPAYRL